MQLVESAGQPPVAYADYFDYGRGWEVGWSIALLAKHQASVTPTGEARQEGLREKGAGSRRPRRRNS
jgi:hypothetical protein